MFLKDALIFYGQKKTWLELLKKKLVHKFYDQEEWVEAINARQSINAYKVRLSYENPLKKEHLHSLLYDLDNKSTEIFEIGDISRFGKELLDFGISTQRINALKTSEIILLEATLFSALADLKELALKQYNPYFEQPLHLNSYFQDYKNLEKEHREIAAIYLEYFLAVLQLKHSIANKQNQKNLRWEGKNLLHLCEKLLKKQKISLEELSLLTQFLEIMTEIIDNPKKAIWEEHKAAIEAIYYLDAQWGELLKSTILALMAISLTILVITSAFATFYTTAPLAPLLLSLSLHSLGFGPSVFIFSTGSLACISLTIGGGFFASEVKGSIAKAGDFIEGARDEIDPTPDGFFY